MAKFDSSKWITENKHGSSFNNELITIFTEVFIQSSLPKGILKENLSLQLEAKISDVIKDKVNKLPSNVKDEFKEFQQSLQGDGVKLIDFLKTAAATFKGVDKKEIPALLASLELKEEITEAKVEGVDSIEALSALKPTNSFTWNQETTELPSDNYSVFGNSDNSQSLIKGQSYTLSPRTKTGDINDTDIRGILLQNNAAREKTSKFKGFIQKIKGKAKTNAVIALTLLTLMVPQMFGDSLNVAQDEFKDAPIENIVAQETGINLDNTLDLGDKLSGGGGGTDIVKVLDIAGGDNPSEAGVQGDFNNDKNSIVTGGKFKTGEYELSESEKDAYINQAFGALASLMDAQIGDSDTKKLTVNSNIILDYSGYISNSGEDANKPNDGTADLQKGRENTALEIATAVKTKIDQYQIDNYGKIIIKVELNKIDNSGFENQDSQETSDYLATQGFKVKTNVNLDFDKSGEPIELVQNDFEYAKYDVIGGGRPTGDKVGGNPDGPVKRDDEEEKKKDDNYVIDDPKDEDEILKQTRRNDQWAFILQKLKPASKGNEQDSLDIYAMIETDEELQILLSSDLSTKDIGFKNKVGTGGDAIVDKNSEISNRTLEITAKEADTQELRELASLILFLRRKPDYLLDKINSFYPEDKQPLNKRAKSKSKFGKFTQGDSGLKEMLGYGQLLNENEALWGKLVPDDLIKQNLNWLVPAAASIWAGEGSTDTNVLTIINQNNVNQDVLNKIKKSFSTTGKAGDKYTFAPDVDRLAKVIAKNPQNIEVKIDQINTKIEFDEFVTAIINRFDKKYIIRGEVPGVLTQIANELPKDIKESINETTVDVEKVEDILELPAIKNVIDKVNSKEEFIQALRFFIDKIESINNSIKKSYLNSLASNYRSQQQTPDFKDKINTTNTTDPEGRTPVYIATKESFKSLAQQLGYIK
tara:strand:+ start:61 stop:2850 length:2790 start_codon:yes stop_codon:yes gene_type:complete